MLSDITDLIGETKECFETYTMINHSNW